MMKNRAMKKDDGMMTELMGLQHPDVGVMEQVEFGRLKVDPQRFQVRNHDANTFARRRMQDRASDQAVEALKEVIEAGGSLDPLIVWEDPTSSNADLWVVDGHHRMTALMDMKAPANQAVWVQRLQASSAEEARQFAFAKNQRTNLNMTQDERRQEVWLMILAGDLSALSYRQIEAAYSVGKSTAERMTKKAKELMPLFEHEAREAGEIFDRAYIMKRQPLWKEFSQWQSVEEPAGDLDDLVVKRFVEDLVKHFGEKAQAFPEEFVSAVAEFIEEVQLPFQFGKEDQSEF